MIPEYIPLPSPRGDARAKREGIRHGFDSAFYAPSKDQICLPARERFTSEPNYYATAYRALFKKNSPPVFFRVRLWTQKELLEQLFAHYDRLDEDLKAELPLKRIWIVAAQDSE